MNRAVRDRRIAECLHQQRLAAAGHLTVASWMEAARTATLAPAWDRRMAARQQRQHAYVSQLARDKYTALFGGAS